MKCFDWSIFNQSKRWIRGIKSSSSISHPRNFSNEQELLSSQKSYESHTLERPGCSKKIDSQFIIKNKQFQQQFSKLYYARLHQMKPKLQKASLLEQPKTKLLDEILELKPNDECIIIGTILKEMKLKPNILLDYEADIEITTQDITRNNFVSDDDFAIVEDDTGRVPLEFSSSNVKIGELLTGIVVGLLGTMMSTGEFKVKNVIYANLAPQDVFIPSKVETHVAFISGLNIGNPKSSPQAILLAFEYLSGLLASSDEEIAISKIAHVVIVGDSIHPAKNQENRKQDVRGSLKAAKLETIEKELIHFDNLIVNLSKSITIDIMPGENDPTNPSLPQQPLHRCLFPNACKMNTVKFVTNPHQFTVDGIQFLGVSGQTVEDAKRYSTKTETVDILEASLRYSHISPTSPDSLDTYPFTESDPFVLEKSPHVYFSSSNGPFQTKIMQDQKCKVRLISIPKFVNSKSIVILNLKTLECREIQFDE